MKNLFYKITWFILVGFLIIGCNQEEPVSLKLPTQSYLVNVDAKLGEMDSMINIDPLSDLRQDLEIYDSINDRFWTYNVLLPPEYSENKYYPVLYLLHGKSSHSGIWTSLDIIKIADYYYSHSFPHLIIIMPDGEDTYYVDDYYKEIKYESFFKNIFLPTVEKNFPISGERDNRFIAGYSMGGYGALLYALKFNEIFSFCYAMSTPADGNGHLLTPSPFIFLKEKLDSQIPYIILDIGNTDRFIQTNVEAHLALELLSVPHDFILRTGGHDSQFWKEGLFLLFSRLEDFLDTP